MALGLSGWARNLENGNVEVEAEGPRPALDALLKLLQRGPSLAHVTRIEENWPPAAGHGGPFEIR